MEKAKSAAELILANKKLASQNDEKEKRAAELLAVNNKLILQNEEMEKLAAELIDVNKELLFQVGEKEKRAAELFIANIELVFQNGEKEKRATELIIANKELAFQNKEKEKRAAELVLANNELLAFTFISSHDLQEPLRKIQSFAGRILDKDLENLTPNAQDYFQRMQNAANRMQQLINDLLAFSRVNAVERKFELTDLSKIIDDVKLDLKDTLLEKQATIEANGMCKANIIVFQFRQLLYNLIGNALKFSNPERPPHIIIKSQIDSGAKFNHDKLSPNQKYCHISISDNGIGFDQNYNEKIFEVFQRLHSKSEFSGTGIGLAIVKKIVDNHNGFITAKGELGKGATFEIYIPSA